ncbi:hypothetical protein ACHAXR_009233 [Thalassiosira sp. AJA248-18]
MANTAVHSLGATTTVMPTSTAHTTSFAAANAQHNIQPQAPSFAMNNNDNTGQQIVSSLHQQQQMLLSLGSTNPGINNAIAKEVVNNCKIPNDVEFLVTSGKIFARYKSSLEPFDPFNLLDNDGSTPKKPLPSGSGVVLNACSPPLPLNARELEELLKLLGPKICLALPWLRVPFNPRKVFAAIKTTTTSSVAAAAANNNGGIAAPIIAAPLQAFNNPVMMKEEDYLRSLIQHQTETMTFLSSNSELNNPMVYSNSYRRAPPVPMVKAQQGNFLYPSNTIPDINNYPTKTAALSISLVDLTINRDSHTMRIPYLDPIKSIRDKMIRMEKSLCGACLLDMRWGTSSNDTAIGTTTTWKHRVEKSNSIRELASLLIILIDACCLKAFVPHWYKLKEDPEASSVTGGGRISPVNNDVKESTTVSDDWNPKLESTRRKWDRCKGNEILRLFDGFLGGVFNRQGPPTKRGKLRKSRDGGANRNSNQSEGGEVEKSKTNEIDLTMSNNTASKDLSTVQKQAVDGDTSKQTSLSNPAMELTGNENDRSVMNGSKSLPSESCIDKVASHGDAKSVDKIPSQNGPGQVAKAESLLPSSSNPSTLMDSQNEASLSTPKLAVEGSNEVKGEERALSSSNISTEEPLNNDNEMESPEANSTLTPSKRRVRGCGKCDTCLQADCRECASCLDMKKYGGPNKLRQKCLKRKGCLMRETLEASTSLPVELESKTPAKKSKSSKKKKKKTRVMRQSSSAPSSSRRRSDRLNIIRQQIECLLGITEDSENGNKIERAILELKLDKLESVLANDDKTAGYWAIAGKKLFEPDGTLSRPIVKWLARNAGSVRAPSISYDTSYEVGETTVCHHWRKRTMACTTYESLLYSLRFLDAHIEKAVTATANTIATRHANAKKSPTTTAVRCVHTDALTGFKEYFVVPNGNKRGCWHLEEKVDLNALIQYRSKRRRSYLEKKEQLDRERKQQEALSASKKTAALSIAGSKRKAPASLAKSKPPAKKPKDTSVIKQKELEFQATVNKHRDETFRLLKASAGRGEKSVPTATMAEARSKNLATMRAANLLAKRAGGKKLSENELTKLMAKAEQDAIQLYVMEMQKARKSAQSRTKSKSNAQQTAQRQPVTGTGTDVKSITASSLSSSTQPTQTTSATTAKNKLLSGNPAASANISSLQQCPTQPPQSTVQPSATAKINISTGPSSSSFQSLSPRPPHSTALSSVAANTHKKITTKNPALVSAKPSAQQSQPGHQQPSTAIGTSSTSTSAEVKNSVTSSATSGMSLSSTHPPQSIIDQSLQPLNMNEKDPTKTFLC